MYVGRHTHSQVTTNIDLKNAHYAICTPPNMLYNQTLYVKFHNDLVSP